MPGTRRERKEGVYFAEGREARRKALGSYGDMALGGGGLGGQAGQGGGRDELPGTVVGLVVKWRAWRVSEGLADCCGGLLRGLGLGG